MSGSSLEKHLSQIKRLPADGTTVAFFDLDRTLIAGYSILAMAREL
jgi:hypothetical protein